MLSISKETRGTVSWNSRWSFCPAHRPTLAHWRFFRITLQLATTCLPLTTSWKLCEICSKTLLVMRRSILLSKPNQWPYDSQHWSGRVQCETRNVWQHKLGVAGLRVSSEYGALINQSPGVLFVVKSVDTLDRGLYGMLLWNFCVFFKDDLQEA